mmetsp:Transcript_16087/g.27353  ORF Transcript_16087/g.27353 Transcript_16087/m.27353 type:complete len:89 (+) Transcript_16087:190-456(+)
MFAFRQPIAQLENGAGEFIPTTVDLSPSVSTITLPKAVSGPAAAHLSWMHARSVVNHALGNVLGKVRRANRSMPTTVIQSTTSNNLAS